MGNRLDAQIKGEGDVVLVALQVFLEHVGDKRNHVGPFKFTTAAVRIFVRVRFRFGGASVESRFRKSEGDVEGEG